MDHQIPGAFGGCQHFAVKGGGDADFSTRATCQLRSDGDGGWLDRGAQFDIRDVAGGDFFQPALSN
jgi:hypothetical protein